MATEQDAMDIAMSFYEHKDPVKFVSDCEAKGVVVHIAETKVDEYIDYVVGGVIHIVRFAKPGKPVAMTIRPVV